jgi:hypothetical protein
MMKDYTIAIIASERGLSTYQKEMLHKELDVIMPFVENVDILVPGYFMRERYPDETIVRLVGNYRQLELVYGGFPPSLFCISDIMEWTKDADQWMLCPALLRQPRRKDRVWDMNAELLKLRKKPILYLPHRGT